MSDLAQVEVPYPVLLQEYQERVAALTNENLMLRATITHMQRTAPRNVPPPAGPEPASPVAADAAQPGAG